MAEESEVSLPRTTLLKMIKDNVPNEMRLANDTVDMLVSCCTEFIQLLSSESNEVATKENRSIISPDHVVKALQELGFPEFIPGVNETLSIFKEESKTTNSQKANLRRTGAEQAGLTEEEQIALQQQLFASARAHSMTTVESQAAMQAAYEQAIVAQAQALQQAGAPLPDHMQAYAAGQPQDGQQHLQQPSVGAHLKAEDDMQD